MKKEELTLMKRQGANCIALLSFTFNFMLHECVEWERPTEESYCIQGLTQMLVPYLTPVASYFP